MNAAQQARSLIEAGEVFDVENTYHDKCKRIRVEKVFKSFYEGEVLEGEWAGKRGVRGSIPQTVKSVIDVGGDHVKFHLGQREGHTVTLRRVS